MLRIASVGFRSLRWHGEKERVENERSDLYLSDYGVEIWLVRDRKKSERRSVESRKKERRATRLNLPGFNLPSFRHETPLGLVSHLRPSSRASGRMESGLGKEQAMGAMGESDREKEKKTDRESVSCEEMERETR